MTLNGRWDAAAFFESLTASNKLAQSEQFVFCRVSGLDGFEEAVAQMQSVSAFVCVSDVADGYTELNNTPRTRRIKTVFFAMRHASEDMEARSECMETMRELFQQFMSRLLLEKVKLEQNCIYLDPRITFNEIDRYFFSGAAGAYFQIAVDVFTDLRHNPEEWTEDFDPNGYDYKFPKGDVWLISYPDSAKIFTLKYVMELRGLSLKDGKEYVESAPVVILENASSEQAQEIYNYLTEKGCEVKICKNGQKP